MSILSAIRNWFLPQETLGSGRSGKWAKVRDDFIETHPACAACGKPAEEVHHIRPFHEEPALELNPDNLVALCKHHHLDLGHLGDYQAWNPLVREDAARHRSEVKSRPYTAASAIAFIRRFSSC